MVADVDNKTKKIQRCAKYIMSYYAHYKSEGEARWEGELMRADWENHYPGYDISLKIKQDPETNEWIVDLFALKQECTFDEH